MDACQAHTIENPRVGSDGDGRRDAARMGRSSMAEDLAAANVNRSYSLAATSIAIFTFTLFFLHPRFMSGEASVLLFNAALVVLGVATFSFTFASFFYYCSSLGDRINDFDRAQYAWRGDRFWLLGYTFLFLTPSLILFSIGLFAVGSVWIALWMVFVAIVIASFPRVRTVLKSG
jgi:hypothetical protein